MEKLKVEGFKTWETKGRIALHTRPCAGRPHTHTHPTLTGPANKAIKVQHERKGTTPQKTPQTGRASKCHRWNSKLLTLADEARKRRQCREHRGARRGRQRGESLCTPDLALAGHIHTHTPRFPGRPTKLSTVNSAISIVQHRGREQRHKSDQKQGARPHIFAEIQNC
jgi:hypothetical protein